MIADISLVSVLAITGMVAATLLIAALIGGRFFEIFRIWPSPPAKSLRSAAYWSLFRTLNVTVLVLAVVSVWADLETGAPSAMRIVLLSMSAASGLVYAYALWALGRAATYCKASGLETRGIYEWSRNPQYATAIVAYGFLAAGSSSLAVTGLAIALIAVYALMALSEEPWLLARYGEAYAEYARRAPRFFPIRRSVALLMMGDIPPAENHRGRERERIDVSRR